MVVGTLKEFEEQEAVKNQVKDTEVKDTVDNTQVKDTQSDEGKESVKESVVVIDGKERPLKNYEAELKRKHDEEIERIKSEYEQRYSESQTRNTAQTNVNWLDQVHQMAENEIATTGKAVPIQTIMQVANQLSRRNIDEVFKTERQSQKAVNSFKRSVRSEPDWKEIEDEFDGLVEQLRPEQINSPTLEVILNSVRGKKMKDILKKTREQIKDETEKDTEILNAPMNTKTNVKKPVTTLTPEQKTELEMLNKDTTMEWTEDEYKQALVKKQNRFKVSGAKNEPQLLNDQMIR